MYSIGRVREGRYSGLGCIYTTELILLLLPRGHIICDIMVYEFKAQADYMNTSIVIKENRRQLVLSPETDHDKEVIKILSDLPNSYRTEFYDTQGGWSRMSSGDKDLVIVFDTHNSTL